MGDGNQECIDFDNQAREDREDMSLENIDQIEDFFDYETSWSRIIDDLPMGYRLTNHFREYLKKLAYTECRNLLIQMLLR